MQQYFLHTPSQGLLKIMAQQPWMVENGCKCLLLSWADCGWWPSFCTSWLSSPATSPPLAASPLADGGSSGWGGKLRQGCMWLETPCNVRQALGELQEDHVCVQSRMLVLRCINKGQDVPGTKSQELAKPALWVQVLLSPPHRRGPHPWLRTSPQADLGGTNSRHRCVRLSEWYFSHKRALKGERRRGLLHSWDLLCKAAPCLPPSSYVATQEICFC